MAKLYLQKMRTIPNILLWFAFSASSTELRKMLYLRAKEVRRVYLALNVFKVRAGFLCQVQPTIMH